MSFFFNHKDSGDEAEDEAWEALKNADHPSIFMAAMVSQTLKHVVLKQMNILANILPDEVEVEEIATMAQMEILREVTGLVLCVAARADLGEDQLENPSMRARKHMIEYMDLLEEILKPKEDGKDGDTDYECTNR